MSGSEEQLMIWITGAAGFLGRRLARHCSALGHRVVGLSRRESNDPQNSVPIDLASDETIDKLRNLIEQTGRPDVVVHAASRQPGAGELADFVAGNVRTTTNLLEALRVIPPLRIIYTSTQSVYQRPASLPVNESAPASGTLPYSATKRWSEQLLEAFQGAPITILRLPSLYGAGQADSFIDGLARLALRNEPIELFARGELIRDALHVNDVVEAIAACLTQPANGAFTLNLGCGRPIKIIDYAQELIAALGSKSVIVPVDRPTQLFDLYADIERARREIAFEPTPLAQAMKKYAAELRA